MEMTETSASGSEAELFADIVRVAGKQHLGLSLRVVERADAGLRTMIVTGHRGAAGYQPGRSWPELFRRHLQGGYFD